MEKSSTIQFEYYRCTICKKAWSGDILLRDGKSAVSQLLCGDPACNSSVTLIDTQEIIDALNMAAITSPPAFFKCNECGVLHEIRSIYLTYIKSREKIRSKGKFQQ